MATSIELAEVIETLEDGEFDTDLMYKVPVLIRELSVERDAAIRRSKALEASHEEELQEHLHKIQELRQKCSELLARNLELRGKLDAL